MIISNFIHHPIKETQRRMGVTITSNFAEDYFRDHFQHRSPPNWRNPSKNGRGDYFQLCSRLFFICFFQLCSPPNKRDPSKKGETIIFNFAKDFSLSKTSSTNKFPLWNASTILYVVVCKNTQDALISKFVVKAYHRGQARVGTVGIISVITR